MTDDVIEAGINEALPEESSVEPASASDDGSARSTVETAAQDDGRELWSKRLSWVILFAMTGVMLISIVHSPAPVKPGEEYFTVCGFKNLTGLPCPGCGLTHSFCEIGKGHLASAMNWNWLGLPLFTMVILVWVQSLLILTNRMKSAIALNRLAARVRPLRLFVLAFVLYGAGRITYILIYDPSARVSNPISRLFKLIGG
jgi:hypothetical protein